MPFCTKCGTKLEDTCKFCVKCGAPVKTVAPIIAVRDGAEQTFPFLGEVLTISAEMDAFNYYRKEFRKLARIQANELTREYRLKIYDLDSFLVLFLDLYAKHRRKMISAAMGVFFQLGITGFTAEEFEAQHTSDFCLCGQDVDVILQSFNMTIGVNQDGDAAAEDGERFTASQITEKAVRSANVTPKQRTELYNRIHFNTLMERAYTDYWRVFLSLTWTLSQKGMGVWYPNAQDNQRANSLYQNMITGRIPEDRMPDQLMVLLSLNPYADDYLKLLNQKYGDTEETAPILEYFGFEA